MAAGKLDEPLPVTIARVRKEFYADHITAVEQQNRNIQAQAESDHHEAVRHWEEVREETLAAADAEYERLAEALEAQQVCVAGRASPPQVETPGNSQEN
jgi:hypothetical protein